MRILIFGIILIMGCCLYLLRKHMKKYFDQKLKDMNEGNLGD